VCLGFVGHQLGERTPEPNRFFGEVAAAAVAFVEDQIDDGEDGGEPVGKQVGGRHPKRDAGGLDLHPRPHEPLGHRLLGDEERSRDLVRAQPAQRPQRERDLRVERERWTRSPSNADRPEARAIRRPRRDMGDRGDPSDGGAGLGIE
jgi:hypothetical protein